MLLLYNDPGAFGQSATTNALQFAKAGLDAGTTYYQLGGRFDKKTPKNNSMNQNLLTSVEY